jgi:hypothetical protein
MDTTLTVDTTPKTDVEYEAAIDQMLMQMQQTHAEIAESHRRSDKLQAETREKMAHLERLLTRLEAS